MPTFYKAQRCQTVADLSMAALMCHAYKHAWDEPPIIAHSFSDGMTGYVANASCGRCGTMRKDFVDLGSYEVWSREYTYPDNYLLVEPAKMPDFRAELWRRKRKQSLTPVGGGKGNTKRKGKAS